MVCRHPGFVKSVDNARRGAAGGCGSHRRGADHPASPRGTLPWPCKPNAARRARPEPRGFAGGRRRVTDPSPDGRAAGQRIVLGHDLSESAELAVGLLARTRWSSATHVRVVSSPTGIGPGVSSFTYVDSVVAHAEQVRQAIQATHDRVASDLREAGLTVDARILPGMPADAILAEADRFGAGLIMVGAHRQSPLTATLLGSVSRAIVERAGCAVLVVRSASAGRVLLATDGSMLARLATSIVATSPMFASSTVRVVGVGSPPPRDSGVDLGEDARSEAHGATIAAATNDAALAVEHAVAALAAEGRRVESELRTGDAASQLVAAARDWPADMVVLGSGTTSTLRRLLLGSAARRVLDDVSASVLIAREPATQDESRPEEAS
jgi:nucleotide-binding universal stress UspA family protein